MELSIELELTDIDPVLLKKQIRCLSRLAHARRTTKQDKNHLEGAANLLEALERQIEQPSRCNHIIIAIKE